MDALQCLLRLNHIRAKLGVKPTGYEAEMAASLDKAIVSISRFMNEGITDAANIIHLSQWRKPNGERSVVGDANEAVVSFMKQA